ncbi:MFS transporter [Pseudoduganella umbonata]|uniref:MFS family permease n=1 Tax=Pseudoduganella umbonata TaxID=864828 RepID=A0A4P8HQA3_9BURK|nr:MFS transporter [Pseudoduganella umbonata]MBB3222765.1 MFS family permease [Pseudoduganella umbonata]QCP10742.1 SLC45 family MFS transporter [Pseudoduganella umbonata]
MAQAAGTGLPRDSVEEAGAVGGAGTGKTGGGAGAGTISSAAAAAGLAGMLGWLLLGDLGIAMRDRAALPSALELLRVAGASDTATSLLLSTVPALLSMFVVPVVGWHSDRYQGRLGRRRPFLLVAAPAGCIALIGLACSPALGAAAHDLLGDWSPGARICRLAAFGLFWTVFDCAALCALSLFTGLVNDVVPFGWLGRFYALFRIVGLGAGIAFHTWVFALTDHYLAEILACTGAVFGGCIVAMCVGVREPPAPAAPAVSATAGRGLPRQFMTRPILWAIAMFVCAAITFNPFNTFYQFFAHASAVPKATLGMLTAIGYAVSIGSAFAIGWLVDRCGAMRISAIVIAVYCVVAALGTLLVDDAASFQAVYLCHVIVSGAWWTAAASMPMALFPRERFVQFNATKDFAVVSASILVGILQGPLLDLSGHDYRLTLGCGAVFSALCLLCLARLRALPQAVPST